jgi:hypothetical protein
LGFWAFATFGGFLATFGLLLGYFWATFWATFLGYFWAIFWATFFRGKGYGLVL